MSWFRRVTAVRLVLAGLVVVAVVGIGLMVIDTSHRSQPKFCTADGVLAPDGQVFGRDPHQGCKFVDADGNVLASQ